MTNIEEIERTIRILQCAYESENLSKSDRKYVEDRILKLTKDLLKMRSPIKKNEQGKTTDFGSNHGNSFNKNQPENYG